MSPCTYITKEISLKLWCRHCASLLRRIFASLARINERVHLHKMVSKWLREMSVVSLSQHIAIYRTVSHLHFVQKLISKFLSSIVQIFFTKDFHNNLAHQTKDAIPHWIWLLQKIQSWQDSELIPHFMEQRGVSVIFLWDEPDQEQLSEITQIKMNNPPRNGYEAWQTSKEQTKMTRFIFLEGPWPCTIFCSVFIHYAWVT